MKSKPKPSVLLVIALLVISPAAFTQWSDTKNKFTDSLHMPVSQAPLQQENSIIVRSYPDSGYFVIWQDSRNSATHRRDIYAQKYDKNGVALWAQDGIPVAPSTNDDHFLFPFNGNYRNYSVAATDSAGGFYMTWINDSLNQYTWRRIFVQNILSDGSRLIPGDGFLVAGIPAGSNYDWNAPQLIADGRKGFYLSYLKHESFGQQVYAYNYKKENGTFVNNGGGYLNEYGRMQQNLGPCGLYTTTTMQATQVYDYHIWPDGQGGCNVVMNLDLPAQGRAVAFNRLVRAKKNSQSQVYRRTTDVGNCNLITTDYAEDDVTVLHKFTMYTWTQTCSVIGPPPVAYSQLNTVVENAGQGFLILDIGGYDYQYVKGLTMPTDGNVNIDVVAFVTRSLVNGNTLTPFTTKVFSRPVEIYDSIPYELASNLTNCYTAIRTSPEGKVLNKFNNFNDTLLGEGAFYYYDFSMAGANNTIYATAIMFTALTNERPVYLQQLKLERMSADSFALNFNTPSQTGVLIGKEVSTGAQSNSISYDDPMVFTDHQGNGVFMIREYYRFVRVSPIRNNTQLAWGAMGKPLGTGIYGTASYRPEAAFLVMDPYNGTGLVSWQDERYYPLNSTGIYMRHLDSLLVEGYTPPNKPTAAFWPGVTFALPSVLYGTSNQWSVIDAYSSVTSTYHPVAEILDNANLGTVEVTAYTHNSTSFSPIRTHNGTPYLNRNYTIKTQNNPPGAVISLRLYFTTAEFDTLRNADPSITNPGMLAVIKQAHNVSAAPATYTPVAGEEIIVPKSWAAVPGGYYIELDLSGFSNFFIVKNENALPVTWMNIYAQWQSDAQAKVSWQVADEVNVEKYIVQHSKDGNTFTNVCTIAATGGTNYSCVVAGQNNAKNYYRVQEIDLDGQTTYSKVVVLSGNIGDNLITLYPNPAVRQLNIQSNIDIRQMMIVDAHGRTRFLYRGQNRITTIDVSKYSKGIYTLLMIDNNGTKHYRKFVVK